MGAVFFIFLWPVLLVWAAVKYLGPVFGIFAIVAAILCIVVLVVAARVLLRARRRWVRIVGGILVGFSIAGILAFAALAVLAFAASAYLNSFG